MLIRQDSTMYTIEEVKYWYYDWWFSFEMFRSRKWQLYLKGRKMIEESSRFLNPFLGLPGRIPACSGLPWEPTGRWHGYLVVPGRWQDYLVDESRCLSNMPAYLCQTQIDKWQSQTVVWYGFVNSMTNSCSFATILNALEWYWSVVIV